MCTFFDELEKRGEARGETKGEARGIVETGGTESGYVLHRGF